MPGADWSASGASFAKPTAQVGIYALGMEDSKKPGSSGSSLSSTACCPFTHLRLVNPRTGELLEKRKHFWMEFLFLNHASACLPHSKMKTQQPLHVATPVRQSLALTKVAGTSVYLKLDSSQPTGSFKIRGIGHLCKTVSTSLPLSGMM